MRYLVVAIAKYGAVLANTMFGLWKAAFRIIVVALVMSVLVALMLLLLAILVRVEYLWLVWHFASGMLLVRCVAWRIFDE